VMSQPMKPGAGPAMPVMQLPQKPSDSVFGQPMKPGAGHVLPAMQPGPPMMQPKPAVMPPMMQPKPSVMQPGPPMMQPKPSMMQPGPPMMQPKPSMMQPGPPMMQPWPPAFNPPPAVPSQQMSANYLQPGLGYQPAAPVFMPAKPGIVPMPPAPFQPLSFAPQQAPPAFNPGKVEIFGSLSSNGSAPRSQPPPNPNQCPFCSQRQAQGRTPCGHGYCGTPCMQNYIKMCYDGSHFETIPCIACRIPLPFPFLVQMFGDENVLRRTLREHVEGVLRARVCPGNEDLFNLLTNYKPMPPFNCSICHQTKDYKERWELACTHTHCKDCLSQRINQSVAQGSYQLINCPLCSGEIPYMDVWCLVSKETRIAYEQIVPSGIVIDGNTGLITYTCDVHPFFHIVLDSDRPWVMCNLCKIRYCTRCPAKTLYQNHVCPNQLNPPRRLN
jgi:hypothetical protein